MNLSHRPRLARVGLATLIVALAGCQVAAPTGTPEGRVSKASPISNGGGAIADNGSLYDQPVAPGAARPTGGVPQPGAPAGPTAVTVPVAAGAQADAVATRPEAPVPAPVTTNLRDAALAGAGATKARVAAATGAIIATPDGKLTLTIPPGALSGDADVRVAPVSTAHIDVPGVYTPGVRFALDLGGAKLAPDALIKVRQVVDPRFVPELQKRDKAFDPAKYSLSQDASGAWVMEMPIHGPASVSPKAPSEPVSLEQFMLAEFGHLPFAPGPGVGRPTFKLQATPQEMFEQTYGKPAPKSMEEWYSYEHSGLFDCGGIESTCWGLDLLSSLGFPIGGNSECGSKPPESPNAVRADVPVEVKYTSDDSSIDGTPAAGATVTWSMLNSPVNGPSQVIADAEGKASTFAVDGSRVSAMAQIDLGPRSGAWVAGTAKAGMAPLQLRVEKNSPHVNLTFKVEDFKLGPSLDVSFTVAGETRTQTIAVADPEAGEAKAQLIVKVANDDKHDFAVTNVVGANLGFKQATPASLKIQRNGEYQVLVELVSTAQK